MMDDFETFKASREKIDPSSRKFSEHQWQKAYAAYCSSRERVHQGGKGKAEKAAKRRSGRAKAKARTSLSSQSPALILRTELRQNSAYGDLRMIVDLLGWIAIGVVVLGGALRLVYYTDSSAALASIMDAAFQVVAVVVLRLLAHVIIDIPDIALRRQILREQATEKQAEPPA